MKGLVERKASNYPQVVEKSSIFSILPIIKKFLPAPKDKRNNENTADRNNENEIDRVYNLAKLPEFRPAGVFTNTQFNNFVAGLCSSQLMTADEKMMFEKMWGVFFFGYGFDSLKAGTFNIVQENEDQTKCKLSWQAKNNKSGIDVPWIMYEHSDDKFIIMQNDRNKDIFMLLASNNSSERFFNAIEEESNKVY